MADKKKKIDPYDVEALEKSLNDSATRVSTIWVSFLIFSLYLLTAAATVTHKQLFLAEPVKLPVLNIDLPLLGFFWLAPILFVVLHAYVLLQVILLARTAAAYDTALKKIAEHNSFSAQAASSLRQRLANTLFAQIFAGSPREREGGFGSLLNFMAWVTLAIAPILILLVFQFKFLPYHSHLATWTHRLLILLEFIVAFQLWPLVLNPQRDFEWPNFRWHTRETAAYLVGLFRPGRQKQAWQGLRLRAIPLAAAVLFIVLSLWLASFPGEPHANLVTGEKYDVVQCKRWAHQEFRNADLRFDRLYLPHVDVVDHEKLEKIVQATSKAGEQPHQGERTRILRDRDFNCADLSEYSDLRRVDLSGSQLRSVTFVRAKLGGATLARANLQGALLDLADLPGALLDDAQLQGSSLDHAQLQGASLVNAGLDGASLVSAGLQATYMLAVRLQGATLNKAQLQGASLDDAQLQGASLDGSQLQGASFDRARLQGASLVGADLQGASMAAARLQGTLLKDTNLDHTVLSGVWVWLALDADCSKARVTGLRNDAVLDEFFAGSGKLESIPATPAEVEAFIKRWTAEIPDERNMGPLPAWSLRLSKEDVRKILHQRLAPNASSESGEIWRRCEGGAKDVTQKDFDAQHIDILRSIVCDAGAEGSLIGAGVARNWISSTKDRVEFSTKLARALLGEDGKRCPAAQDYDFATKKRLRTAAGPPPAVPAAPAAAAPAPAPK